MLPLKNKRSRWVLALIAFALLTGVYIFQRSDILLFSNILNDSPLYGRFVINKTFRFLLNEAACLLLIIAIFNNKRYVRIGFLLFLAEFFVLLPLYFILKLTLEGDGEISSPLLSQLHRMIINPLLMLILILALMYQDFVIRPEQK